jgi:hypothetical protein
VAYRYFNVTNTYPTDVWVRAAVVRPGNVRVVHHSLVMQGTSGTGIDGFFASYVPGYDAVAFPTNTGKFLPRNQVLRFQMHYTTDGTAQTDQTQLGLYISPATPTYTLQTKSAYNYLFQIPANTNDFQTTAQYPPSGALPKSIVLYEMSPHMHLRGSRFKFEILYSNNTRETLLSVPNYVFHWQALYRLAQPKTLPAGSRIVCTGAWDNSPQNQELMHEYIDYSTSPPTTNSLYAPSRAVTFGEQSYDEMFIGYINFVELP